MLAGLVLWSQDRRAERRLEISMSQVRRLGKRSSPLECWGEDSEK